MTDINDMPFDPLWYKDAIIYQLHVKAFADSNQDGIGDFPGLTSKLDYLKELGVNTLWLLPFYPSPLKDDGYDIADYTDIHPSYGTMRDFRVFVREAHKRGLRVITELVINHTSDQHPWFQRAREAKPGSRYRNFYVWSDTDQKYQGTRIIFSDTETSNWAWDSVAKAYYWHRFFSHQPDLNFANPEVVESVIRIMYYWLDMGVDGLRLDAVPYLCEREGTNNENLEETHAVIRHIRAKLDARYEGRLLLAEANQWPEDVRPYFSNGDECHMAFHFPLMPRIYMAVAQEDRHPITDIMSQTPDIPDNCQWATFLRNHDELTLEMVTDKERDYLWNFYAADKRARINLGIRRRLAPLMENDRRKMELLNSLLMSMPGTPVIYYGDEIGMGDNFFLGDRNGVRTPMQWSPDRNGGFSRIDPHYLYLPVIMDPIYGYQAVNVETQLRTQNSLLNWMRHLMHVVKGHKSFSRGDLRFLSPRNRKVLAYVRTYGEEKILCVVNLSRSPQSAELDLKEFKGLVPLELLGKSPFPAIGDLPYFITLSAYGFFWFSLIQKETVTLEETVLPAFATLVLPDGLTSLLQDKQRLLLEKQLLPEFLVKQRWYKAKAGGLPEVKIQSYVTVNDYRLLLIDVSARAHEMAKYIIAFGMAWEEKGDDPLERLHMHVISRLRKAHRVGVLYEAFHDERLIRALLASTVIKGEGVKLVLEKSPHFPEFSLSEVLIHLLGVEQSNTSVAIGHEMVMKIFRSPGTGINPDVEISSFLAEKGFTRTPEFLGSMAMVTEEGEPITVAILNKMVKNQGNGWEFTLNYLDRFLDDITLLALEEVGEEKIISNNAYFIQLMLQLGIRVGEMHRVLLLEADNPAFAKEKITEEDRKYWVEEVLSSLQKAYQHLSDQRAAGMLSEEIQRVAEELFAKRTVLTERIESLIPYEPLTFKTRLHRDLHLGQVLIAENDFYIIDFEGEPMLPLAKRREKSSPFKDVAGMIRSFDYVAASALQEKDLTEEEHVKCEAALELWRKEAIESFLEGYQATYFTAEEYVHYAEEFKRMVQFFLIEKALYEIIYEAENRPGWIGIPVKGLAAMLRGEEEM